MKCFNEEIIQRYIDGETSVKENDVIEKHLAACDECAQKVKEAKEKAENIKHLIISMDVEPVGVPAFDYPKRRKISKHHPKRWLYVASIACVLVFAILYINRNEKDQEYYLSYEFESEFNANLPISEQDMTVRIYDSNGMLVMQ